MKNESSGSNLEPPESGCNKVKSEDSKPVEEDKPPSTGFVISPKSNEFRCRLSNASISEWNDWHWQLRSRIRNTTGLSNIIQLTDDEKNAISQIGDHLPVGITPYYASLIDPNDPADPIRKMMVPVSTELTRTEFESDDPLSEEKHMPVPGLVHRYPDRVLFLVTNFCATYCRYCTRARMVGQTGEYHFNTDQYQQALDYIAAHPEIRDVLLSGGDPLTMMDERLEWLLERIKAIPHIEMIRIGTKVPCVLPQRITLELCNMLRKYHPLFISIHFMHPVEITPEVSRACCMLADAGIPLGSQTVLASRINDDSKTMKKLMHELLKIRVKPYYIYACDPISGSGHFRTPVQKGLEIISGIRGHTTGYGVPTFVIDAPGGGGKIPITPDSVIGHDPNFVFLRNYEGKEFKYPDRPVAV
jgi:lysine 2,3-aminomutase